MPTFGLKTPINIRQLSIKTHDRNTSYRSHVDEACLAGRAGVEPALQQVLEAGAVEQVATVWDVTRNTRRVNVLKTHGTV